MGSRQEWRSIYPLRLDSAQGQPNLRKIHLSPLRRFYRELSVWPRARLPDLVWLSDFPCMQIQLNPMKPNEISIDIRTALLKSFKSSVIPTAPLRSSCSGVLRYH